MRKPSSLSLALVLLLLLSGCSLLADSEQTPPGVEDGELVNRTALFESHRAAVFDNGAVIRIRWYDKHPKNRNLTRVIHMEPMAAEFLMVTRDSNGSILAKMWGNRSVVIVRNEVAGTVRRVPESQRPDMNSLIGLQVMAEWLGPTHPINANKRVEWDGRDLTVISGQRETPSGVAPIEFHLAVDTAGRIWSGRYTAPGDSGSQKIVFYNMTRMGNIEVEKPKWVNGTSPEKRTVGRPVNID